MKKNNSDEVLKHKGSKQCCFTSGHFAHELSGLSPKIIYFLFRADVVISVHRQYMNNQKIEEGQVRFCYLFLLLTQ